ncbi:MULTISPECIES: FtsX-like permease family protein [Microbacterium]|uniref:ABC transporter permease n=1 Tax=Microbacterium TaxID=33882 RepID=UPI001EF4C97A|nr:MULTISPECIES: FtsX-like permease family protein [Microbacterium]
MIVTVMLTTGRTVGAEQRVLSSIDSAGTRSILVRADAAAGVTSDVIDRIDGIEGVEWSAAFSSAVDATNGRTPDGARAPVRFAYGRDVESLGVPARVPLPGQLAYGSQRALDELGLPDIAGGIVLTTGQEYAMAGLLEIPDFLVGLEPVVIVPQPEATGEEPVSVLVVIASRPDLVAPVSDAVLSVLAAEDPSKVSVETSEPLAQLRGLIQGQLSTFSRGLVLVMIAVTGLLVAVILYGLVMMRRKDFGRRRALGATRALIVLLLFVQTVFLAVIGVLVGTVVSVAVLVTSGDPLPGPGFFGAVSVLALGTSAVASLVPAIIASRREPIRELRVP